MSGPAPLFREIHRLRRYARDLQEQLDRIPRQFKAHQARLQKREEDLRAMQEAIRKLKVTASDREKELKARHEKIRWVHSDWMTPGQRGAATTDFEALLSLRPAKLLLTQFDYFRRFEPVVTRLKSRREVLQLELMNTARTPAPDSFPALQKVVQHVAWAPVVISLQWR